MRIFGGGGLTPLIDAANIGPGTVSNTEFGYLDGVTSAIQTQLNGKAATSHTHAISDVTNLQSNLDAKLTGRAITTAGTGTAYTAAVTGYTLTDGALLVLEWHTASTGTSATLNVNSTGAKSIRRSGSATLPVGVLAAGRKYELAYNATADAYDLVGLTQVVAGDIASLAGTIPDAGTTGGTSTAYTATLASRPEPLTAGYAFMVVFNQTNGAGPTLSLSSGTAQAIWYNGQAITTAWLIPNIPYILRSDGTRLHIVAGRVNGDLFLSQNSAAGPNGSVNWCVSANSFYVNVPSGAGYYHHINGTNIEAMTSYAYSCYISGTYKVQAGGSTGEVNLGASVTAQGAARLQMFDISNATYPGLVFLLGGAVTQASNGTWTTRMPLTGASWYGLFEVYDTVNRGRAIYEITGTTLTFVSGPAEYVASGSESATTISLRSSGGNLQLYVGTSVSTRKFHVRFLGITQ